VDIGDFYLMRLPNSSNLKWLVRSSLVVLTLTFWKLGKIGRSYLIRNSPDGRFSTFLVVNRGWRSIDYHGQYLLYLEDNWTGETLLTTKQAEYLVLEHVLLNDIRWQKNSRSFNCIWAVQYNGYFQQKFDLQTSPLRVKVTPNWYRAANSNGLI
jgi:hypothetical protein